MNQLKNFFAEVSEKVEKQLDILVPSGEIEPKRLHAAMRWSLFGGGKRFRPALVLLSVKHLTLRKKNFCDVRRRLK